MGIILEDDQFGRELKRKWQKPEISGRVLVESTLANAWGIQVMRLRKFKNEQKQNKQLLGMRPPLLTWIWNIEEAANRVLGEFE